MELLQRDFKAKIFCDFRQGLTQKQRSDRMKSMFGNEVPSKTTIYIWFKEFSRRHKCLSDDVREGRPRSSVTTAYIGAVRKLIASNLHVMCDEIEICLNISRIRMHSILHGNLKVK